MKKTLFMAMACALSFQVQAEIAASVFWYQEKETGTEPSNMRYLVAAQYLRIDEGQVDDDYILFDAEKSTIYSVNQRDRTVMVIDSHQWRKPEFDFDYQVTEKALSEAPRIGGKTVHNYTVSGDHKVCTDVHLVPGLYPQQMALLQRYQQVLSGQQVRSLHATPDNMQTPCFLADQVYNDGAYYARGLPIQVWHSRGYGRLLIDYSDQKVSEQLFTLPDDFRLYEPFAQEE